MDARHSTTLRYLVLATIISTVFVATVGAGIAGAEEIERKNSIELFLGGTTSEGDTAFAIGLGYERRLNELLGIGVLGDWTAGGFRELVLAFPLYLHPWRGLRFDVAPGIDFETDGEEAREFLLRVGAAYEFEVGESWSIVPEINGDFAAGEPLVVWGVSFGYRY